MNLCYTTQAVTRALYIGCIGTHATLSSSDVINSLYQSDACRISAYSATFESVFKSKIVVFNGEQEKESTIRVRVGKIRSSRSPFVITFYPTLTLMKDSYIILELKYVNDTYSPFST